MDISKAKSFLDSLGIKFEGQEQNGKYVIDLKDSDTYSKVYTILDKSELVDLDIESINMNEEESTMVYLSYDYDITLGANFDENEYTLTIEEADE